MLGITQPFVELKDRLDWRLVQQQYSWSFIMLTGCVQQRLTLHLGSWIVALHFLDRFKDQAGAGLSRDLRETRAESRDAVRKKEEGGICRRKPLYNPSMATYYYIVWYRNTVPWSIRRSIVIASWMWTVHYCNIGGRWEANLKITRTAISSLQR